MITRFNWDKLAKNLPDAYRKDDGSNNAKILAIEYDASGVLREAVRAVDESLDIDKAYGQTLDLYGEMLGQRRGLATDEQYRVLLKNKIQRNFTNSDMNSIIRALCTTFGCVPTDVLLAESDEPCLVSVNGLPLDSLVKNDIDTNTAIAIVRSLLPVGVHIEAISFAGSFEFADAEMVYDEGKGFADEAQTMGGTLGLVAGTTGGALPV